MSKAQTPVAGQAEKSAGRALTNLTLRSLTAVIAIPLSLTLIALGGWYWNALILSVGLIALLEYHALARGAAAHAHPLPGSVALALFLPLAYFAYPWSAFVVVLALAFAFSLMHARLASGADWRLAGRKALFAVGGVLYIGLPSAALCRLRVSATDGALWLTIACALTWVTDSASYFGGRLWGRRSLAPRISPKKTREGALSGWLAGALAGYLFLRAADLYDPRLLPLLLLAPLAAILGDLFESGLKRQFDAKDSRLAGWNLFPGHGGVLDRIDSLFFVIIVMAIYLALVIRVI